MNAPTFFSLISNVALFFMFIYFLFKIKAVKAAMIYHTKTRAEFIAAIALTLIFSVLNILASVLGIQIGNAIANIRTGVVVVATALLGPLPGIIVAVIGSVYRLYTGRLDNARLLCGNPFLGSGMRRHCLYTEAQIRAHNLDVQNHFTVFVFCRWLGSTAYVGVCAFPR